MGQIVNNGKVTTVCNLRAVQSSGTKYTAPIAEGEIWMIDSTNSNSGDGSGKYDRYIVGDGTHNAGYLAANDLRYIAPTALSQLIEDENHQTVTAAQKTAWSSGTGGGTAISDSDDIVVIAGTGSALNHLQFANKEYDVEEYSGLGKKYLRKNIQTVPVRTSENLFNAFEATDLYNTSYTNAYNAKYKELIEAGTYDADGKTAANSAYTTAYNKAIAADKTIAEATNIGNAEYVNAYKAAIKGDEDKEAAVASVNTTSDDIGKDAGNTAWETEYPNVAAWNRQYYIDGRFTTVGNDKYINITPQYRFSLTSCRINVHAGEIYKIFGKKTDSAGGVQWVSRFWMITETPTAGATQAKVLQAYKIDNEDYSEQQANETVFIEVENDGVLWINYNTYATAAGQCTIERISNTSDTIEVNSISGIDTANTEYIIQYDYDLNGSILHVPQNCILRFEGGSITNGYIVGDNTTIIASASANILTGITLLGTWKNVDFYAKWFGAAGDGITDDTDVLQSMLDISANINSYVNLIWYNNTFRTTRELYIKGNVSIKGGTIKAKFANQMCWVLKTYNYVSSAGKVYGSNMPGAFISWQEHDNAFADAVGGNIIQDLTIIGEYNEHLTNGEPDGTYTPIYGGLCLMSTSLVTDNVTISNVGVGLGRGACLRTYDNHLNIKALFVGFAGYAINGHTIRDSYINAYCKTEESPTSTPITPFYPQYQSLATAPKSGYVYNQGGIDMTDDSNKRPYFCNIQLTWGYSVEFDNTIVGNPDEITLEDLEQVDGDVSLIADNVLVDVLSEVFVTATAHSSVSFRHPWLEAVTKCMIYSTDSKVKMDSPAVAVSPNDYDIYANSSTITLCNCRGNIECSGGISGERKKYNIDNSTKINVLDARVSPYPTEDDRFYFLTSGSAVGLPVSVIPSSGTGSLTNNTLNAAPGTYYRFNYTVNTLIVNLPDMTGVSSLRPVMLYVETGSDPNISFISADNKTVTQFSNYEIDMNSKYEINCLYNGTKWIVAAAVID